MREAYTRHPATQSEAVQLNAASRLSHQVSFRLYRRLIIILVMPCRTQGNTLEKNILMVKGLCKMDSMAPRKESVLKRPLIISPIPLKLRTPSTPPINEGSIFTACGDG